MNDLSIEKRLEKLERSNKKLRFVNFLMLAIIFSGGLIGWQVTTQYFQTIETEKLVLKDKNGNIRATLNVDENNSTYLSFYCSEGKISNILGVNEHNFGVIEIRNSSPDFIYEKTRISPLGISIENEDINSRTIIARNEILFMLDTVELMQLISNGFANQLVFTNFLNKESTFDFSSSPFLSTRLLLKDIEGKNIIRLGDDIDKEGYFKARGIEIYDDTGNTLALLGGYKSGQYSTMQLFAENKALLYLVSRPKGSMIAIDDKKENPIVVIESGENYNSPSVSIRKNEKFAFQVGIDKNNYSYQYLYDNLGKVRMRFEFNNQNKPAFTIYDASGMGRTVIGSSTIYYNNGTSKKLPESSIWLFNESGNSLFSAPND